MTTGLKRIDEQDPGRYSDTTFDVQALLHPATAFSHPADVARDPDLTLNEKRGILASWASDACAVESVPALRMPPFGGKPVTYDDVMDALRDLDKQAADYGKAKLHDHFAPIRTAF